MSESWTDAKQPEERSRSTGRPRDVPDGDVHGRPARWRLDLHHVVKAFGPLEFPFPLNEPPLLLWLKISGRIDRWRAAPVCLRCGMASGQSAFERWGERGVLCSVCAMAYERGVSRAPLDEALAGLARRRGRPNDVEADREFLELYVGASQKLSADGKRPTMPRILRHMNQYLPPERKLALRTLQDKLKRYGL